MKRTHVFCDSCHREVKYYLIDRYNIDEVLKNILRRNVIDIDHLCEPCMHGLNSAITEAIDKWKAEFVKENDLLTKEEI